MHGGVPDRVTSPKRDFTPRINRSSPKDSACLTVCALLAVPRLSLHLAGPRTGPLGGLAEETARGACLLAPFSREFSVPSLSLALRRRSPALPPRAERPWARHWLRFHAFPGRYAPVARNICYSPRRPILRTRIGPGESTRLANHASRPIPVRPPLCPPPGVARLPAPRERR